MFLIIELALLFVVSAALLVGVGVFIGVRYRGLMARLPLPRFVRFAFIDHTLLGEPFSTDRVLHRAGYSLGYDDTLRAARWVSYVVTEASHSVGNRRVSRTEQNFQADPNIPSALQRTNADYTGSGYDRGHLAPSATVDFTRRSNRQTFYMSNVLPQHPKLNRQAWSSLEHDVRRWAKQKGRLVVVCGPVFATPSSSKKAPVPEYFFKVVYSWKHNQAIGFLFPNKPVRAESRWKHACSIAHIEKTAGIRLFHGPRWLIRRVNRKDVNIEWWKKGS